MTPMKIGTKELIVFPEAQALSQWIKRPACTEDAYPLKGALAMSDGEIIVAKTAKDAFAYFAVNSNDVQNARVTFMLSSAYGRGYGTPVMGNNFEKCLEVWAARTLPDHSWHNNRDQFQQPNCDLPEDFITDCAVWDLFHGSNQTSALKDVEYKGKTYQVRNQFFPYTVEWLRSLEAMPQEVFSQLRSAKDTFVATWLNGRTLSPEAQALLDAGRKVYEVFYREYTNLNRTKFKLSYWDAGWYQIRNALLDAGKGLEELNAVKIAHNKLRDKLRPKVYEYGFLSPEIMYDSMK